MRYQVVVPELHLAPIEVEAQDEDEARLLVMEGRERCVRLSL